MSTEMKFNLGNNLTKKKVLLRKPRIKKVNGYDAPKACYSYQTE
jgi:hypothetical protein